MLRRKANLRPESTKGSMRDAVGMSWEVGLFGEALAGFFELSVLSYQLTAWSGDWVY